MKGGSKAGLWGCTEPPKVKFALGDLLKQGHFLQLQLRDPPPDSARDARAARFELSIEQPLHVELDPREILLERALPLLAA